MAARRKDEELREVIKNSAILREQAAREAHVYQKKADGTLFHAFNPCLRCYHQGLADNMDIGADEWPLPLLESQAKATVFELCCLG